MVVRTADLRLNETKQVIKSTPPDIQIDNLYRVFFGGII